MGIFLVYMIKSAFCLILFYVFFKAFLSRETFFRLNRFVLLGGMLGCMLLPSVRFEVPAKVKAICAPVGILEREWKGTSGFAFVQDNKEKELNDWKQGEDMEGNGINELFPVRNQVVEKGSFVRIGMILSIIYLLGALSVGGWLGMAFWRIRKLFRYSDRKKMGKYTLVLTTDQVCPFSWGKYIVLSNYDYQNFSDTILMHELIHVDRKHTLDLCFVELFLIIQWFNPAVWLLKKALQEIHEYEADNGVIHQGIDATQYQLLLVKKAVDSRLYSIANSFNHSKLKNRITMMLKEKSNRWARLKTLLLLPLTALLMLAFARPEEIPNGVSSQLFKVMQNPGQTEMTLSEISDTAQVVDSKVLMSVICDVEKTFKDGTKRVYTKICINSKKAVDEEILSILKGYGLYSKIYKATIEYAFDCPEIYIRKIQKAFEDRGVKDVKLLVTCPKLSGEQLEKMCDTIWTEERFKQELQKNRPDKTRATYQELHTEFGDRLVVILMNRLGQISLYNQLVSLEQLQSALMSRLKEGLSAESVYLVVQHDREVDQEKWQQLLNTIGKTYTKVRLWAGSQNADPYYPDKVCPIRVDIFPAKAYSRGER